MEAEMSLRIRKPGIHHWMVTIFMVACFAAASVMMPHVSWYEHLGKPEYEKIVPKQFGDWVESADPAGSAIVDPQQQEALDNLYTQIVSRTYMHKPSGRHLMLSVAYGDIQTYSRQLHRPESCYSSQGFKIESLHEEQIRAVNSHVSVKRMVALAGQRREYVTYFIRIGDRVISGPSSTLNFARMEMGLKGYVADGLLFRVSENSEEPKSAYQLQDQFINELLTTLSHDQQATLVGALRE